jgi:hypothetical protein
VGTPPPGTREVIFDCTVYTGGFRFPKVALWSGAVSIPLETVPSVDDILRPDRSPELTEAMRAAPSVNLFYGYRENSHPPFGVLTLRFDDTGHPILDPVGLGVAVDVLRDGNVVGTQRFRRQDFWPATASRSAEATIYLHRVADDAFSAPDAADHWTIRVRGDGEMALTDWDRDQYWAGEFTLPLSDVLAK